jgi:hypothetical protein
MKVFDFTSGRKGELVGNIKRAGAMHGCLVSKNGKTFRVELANRPAGWEWHTGATWLRYEKGEPVEDMPIRPEDFGVEAICFSTGAFKIDGQEQWQWTVLGTTDWNRQACKDGILKATKQ